MKRYVALGSSMAAGPGIRPRAEGAPLCSGRSARNYPHLVAERLSLELVDVTFSGATTAHLLADHQRGRPPQITALDGSEDLVTVTVGGNDVGYVPLLMAASLPAAAGRAHIRTAGPRHARWGPGRRVRFAVRGRDGAATARAARPRFLRRLSDDPAARGCAGPAAAASGRRPRAARGRDARTPHGRRGRGDRVRGRRRRQGQPGSPCLVGRAVDDHPGVVRRTAAGPAGPAAPQRRRYARGRGISCRATVEGQPLVRHHW